MLPSSTVTLPIAGMTCASCVGRVEKVLQGIPGVADVAINLATERAEIRMSHPVPRAALVEAIAAAGYDVPAQTLELAVRGMTCASCVGRVEKALARVPGVSTATVNLATERASVTGTADPADLIRAIEMAGYEARPLGRGQVADLPDKSAEDAALRRDMLFAALLTAPVFAMEMGGHLFPAMHHWVMTTIGMRESWAVQAVLATLVLSFPGRRFLIKGLPALARGAPDMNALVAVGTLAAWGYSMVATLAPSVLPPGTAQVYFEAAAVIVTLILLGRWMEARARGQTSQAIRRLVGLQPATARVQRPDGPAEVPLETVVPGDLILLRPGERVPVDGVVTGGSSHIDESMLTGEPMPVDRSAGDPVTAGTINQTGALTFRATAVGADTVLARIIRMVEQAQASKLPVQELVDRVTLWFVPAVMGIAGLTFAVWLAVGPDLSLALVNAVAVLIVACPCAMGLATPTSILVGTGRGAELGVLFRQGAALQRLRDARIVAVDKTGTLTLGRPELTDLDLAPGLDRADVLTRIAAVEALSEHPVARAIVAAAPSPLPQATAFVSQTGQGVQAIVDGERVEVGSARFMAMLGIDTTPFADTAAQLAGDGKSPLYAAIGGRAAAVLAVADVLRDTTPAAIRALQDLGLTVAMITGDDARTAQAIGRRLGIDHVVAEVLPEGKVEAVRVLRALHGPVAFVGDGINDAPALAAADVGIAVGSGTDVAIEAADVVLMRGGLAGVPTAIALSHAVIRNIRQNLFWAFAYNAALIPLAAGVLYPATGLLLSPILAAGAMAASSVFVLGNALRLRGFQGVLR